MFQMIDGAHLYKPVRCAKNLTISKGETVLWQFSIMKSKNWMKYY